MEYVDPVGVLSENFFHGLTLGEFIDQFVEISDFLHEGIVNIFHSNTAHNSGDQGCTGIEGGRIKEVGERCFLGEVALELSGRKTGKPTDHVIQFGGGSTFFLDLVDVVHVDGGNALRIDPGHAS